MKKIVFITAIFAGAISPCFATDTHQHGGVGIPFPISSVSDFTLTSQDNRPVSLKDFRGKVVLINFIYTNCKETCPALIHKFLEVQDAFKARLGKDLILISITIDPERDTPAVLKGYAKTIGAGRQGWFFLTGKP